MCEVSVFLGELVILKAEGTECQAIPGIPDALHSKGLQSHHELRVLSPWYFAQSRKRVAAWRTRSNHLTRCLGRPEVPVIFVSGHHRQRSVICPTIKKRSRAATTRPGGIWLLEAIKVGDRPVMGCACPLENSNGSFSREMNGLVLSDRRRSGKALAAADPVWVEENHEDRKFSVQRSLEVLNQMRSEPHN
jgi:hypothetical protein